MTVDAKDESQLRRRRINLYKKIIIGFLIMIIILPTILCIILFCKINRMNREISELRLEREDTFYNVQLDKNEPESALQGIESGDVKQTEPETESPTIEEEPQISTEQQLVAEAVAQGRKVVYLTFDDGPCSNTDELLDMLDSYGVKVTFFINGHLGHEDVLLRIINEGHSLGMHTYTHEYENVYASVECFINEVDSIQDYILETTGYTSLKFRFPGGSSTSMTVIPITKYIDYLDTKDIEYYDWNVTSGDGSFGLTSDEVYNNVMSGVAINDVSIVLMHDTEDKTTTFDAVPRIIESLQAMNALILPITEDTEPVHHTIN